MLSLSDITHLQNKNMYIYANKNIWMTTIFFPHIQKIIFQKRQPKCNFGISFKDEKEKNYSKFLSVRVKYEISLYDLC